MIECALYVVATPIGNLDDMVPRGRQILQSVSLVAAEDTRRTRQLLEKYGIDTRVVSCHEHNEGQRIDLIAGHLEREEPVALVSDAGTPLISDPGYRVVSELRERGYPVIPVPGPCAMVAALSVSGLPTDAFVFEGFLPAKPGQRRQRLEAMANEGRTLVFYESTHRLVDSLKDMSQCLGGERRAYIARELTKAHESHYFGSLDSLSEQFFSGEERRGEFVVVVSGAPVSPVSDELDDEVRRLADLLAVELPPRKASRVVAEYSSVSPKSVYNYLANR